ncbi:MAG: ABC transporter ATP-binding protein [Proteobacteria bacterium]|nr:ABC transporter ATP-binding protein [Pseudomonadota bacterium]
MLMLEGMNTPQHLPSTIFAFIRYFMRPYRAAFIVLLIAPVAHVLESNVLPYALKLIVDALTNYTGPKAEVMSVLSGPITLYFAVWVAWVVNWRIQEWVGTHTWPKFQADIRMTAFDYVKQHSHQYFADHFAGSIAGKIADLPRYTQSTLDFVRWRIITTVSVTLAAIIMLAVVSPIFSAIICLWVCVQLSIAYFMGQKVDHYANISAENRNILQGHIVDVLTNITTMRLFSRSLYERSYVGVSQDIEKKSHRRVLVSMWNVRMAMELPALFTAIALMLYSIHGWQMGWMTIGDVVFVISTGMGVLHVVWMLSTELPDFFSSIGTVKQALSIINRAHDVTDVPDAKPIVVKKGEIVFDNVQFHYIAGKDIFRNKSITIKAGEKVGLVGFSGSGKSTFVNLILRLYDVEGGRILIDGQDIKTVTQDSLRHSISMIPQDTTLFHRTLMENIRYGRTEATDAEVFAASRQARCDAFIQEVPGGYSALVGERGIKLSGGQRQRIAIARAILKNAPILILDEATSSLDSITEKYIQETLYTLMEGRTTIVIAHRLSTLAEMDRILVFKEGEIIENGTHAELLKAAGHYAKLWNMQAGGFLPDAAGL